MKVDRKKFEDAIDYLTQIEKEPLEKLNLSEFFNEDSIVGYEVIGDRFLDENNTKTVERPIYLKEGIEIHKLTGLNNRDFLKTNKHNWK